MNNSNAVSEEAKRGTEKPAFQASPSHSKTCFSPNGPFKPIEPKPRIATTPIHGMSEMRTLVDVQPLLAQQRLLQMQNQFLMKQIVALQM